MLISINFGGDYVINEENIKSFSKLSDDEIKKRISAAAVAGNISTEKLKNVLSDTEKVKSVISGLTPKDIERLINIVGRENAEKMAEKLKNNL